MVWLRTLSRHGGVRFALAFFLTVLVLTAQAEQGTPASAQHPSEAELAINRFKVPTGLKVDLWAAEPMLANPVAFNFDEQGRLFLCETYRLHAGVDDIRGIMDWLDEELASRTADDRLSEMKRHLGDHFESYTNNSERIRLIEDRDGDGKADHSSFFAEGFNHPLDGIGAGVLPRKGTVWYANIPNFWLLRETNHSGKADSRQVLHHGYGVRVGFLGHDLHGVHFGPDGKLYFSIGDRGSNVKLEDGRTVGEPDCGSVFRCNPDGSELEVFAYGLRNPQDLVFDNYGNLFTGDNNSDSGDEARWVYLVEGGDSGWRVGFQFMENPYSRGPFNAEKLWYPPFQGQAANIVPPVANVATGPSGVAYFPGTGLPQNYQGHFFLVDFRGGPVNSGVLTFTLKPKGAGFELVNPEHFFWGVLATDIKFGPAGGAYVSDWVEGWEMTGKGRIYRVHDPGLDRDPLVLQTKELLAAGFEKKSLDELATLLSHVDIRIRQEAQFELASRGTSALPTLTRVAEKGENQLARLHAIWGIGQVTGKLTDVHASQWGTAASSENREAMAGSAALDTLVGLLADTDSEVQAQAAKVLGDRRCPRAYDGLLKLVANGSPRPRFFAAMSLGKLGRHDELPVILEMLGKDAGQDPYIRHAGVMALVWIADMPAILSAAADNSPAIRMASLLAMRRLHRGEIARFLRDPEPLIVLEAARAINDEPINGAMAELASLIELPTDSEPLLRRVLNANFHFGTTATAKALASFAARVAAPPAMRVEALEELADWPHPSGRDRVVGLWRPVAATRSRETAADALEAPLSGILKDAPEKVRVAALAAVAKLAITNAGPAISSLVVSSNAPSAVRVAALNALAATDHQRLSEAIKTAQSDQDEDLRKAALRLEASMNSSGAAARLSAALEKGSTAERQAALASLGSLKDPSADAILSQWMDRLAKDRVRRELRLDVLEAAAKRSSPEIKSQIAAYQAAKSKTDPLAPYDECMYGGDAAVGKTVFYDRPDVQCVRCHKINGQGGDVGPDLSHVSAQKDRHYLLESIVTPNAQIAQGFDSITVVLKDGDSASGVLKSENADQIVLQGADGNFVTVKKSDVQSRQKALSPMPEGLAQILTKQELRSLVEYLSTMK
jgi:quinoprotein glucose dehydrogenase